MSALLRRRVARAGAARREGGLWGVDGVRHEEDSEEFDKFDNGLHIGSDSSTLGSHMLLMIVSKAPWMREGPIGGVRSQACGGEFVGLFGP